MTSPSDDPSFLAQMLEDFRAGSSSERRITKIVSRFHSDCSKGNPDSGKRKQTPDEDSAANDSIKFLKLDVTPRNSSDSTGQDSRCASPVVSPWENHRARSQLLEANLKISELETQISRHHSLRQEMELLFQKERDSLQKQVDSKRSIVKELENHLQVIRKREADIKEELKQCKLSANKDKINSEERIQNLQRENSKLLDSLHEMEHKSQHERITAERHIEQLTGDISERNQELEQIQKRNSELEQRIREELLFRTQFEQLSLELQLAQRKIKEFEKEKEEHFEAASLVKSRHEKVLRYSGLQKEVEDLKEENRNLKQAIGKQLLLEEMVQDLETRQALFEEQGQELAWAQGRISHLQTELNDWCNVAKEYCDGHMSSSYPPDPAVIKKKINELQQRVHVLSADLSETKSQLNDERQRRELLAIELQGAKREIEKFHNSGEQQNNKLKLLQRKLHLVTTERDSYRSQLDSYEKDLTISSSSVSGQHNQELQQRIETMQRILDGYHKLEKVEMESDRAKYTAGNNDLMEKLNHLQCECNTLIKEKEQLQKRKDELEVHLEYRALKGDYNPVTSKVLHFKMNPFAEANAQYDDEVKRLKLKCSHLEERIKLMEEGNVHDITQKVEQNVASSNSQEIEGLQEIINSQELKMQRLKEVFHASAKEFREVCYELFGYKIDRNENIYKLSNMYAESPDDHLMFKRMPDGTIDMMETSYSATLEELIDIHLHHHNSLPLFLGGVTVELFNRQTMSQSISQPMKLC